MKVLLVAEQLRRRVPGGIGTYVRGLATGLAGLGGGPDVTLWASARKGGDDPLESLGRVHVSRLPPKLLTRAWDVGLAGDGESQRVRAASRAFVDKILSHLRRAGVT